MSVTKYIIVNGGVISGVGKGIITASVGKILQQYGFTVTAMKIDPYVNIDAGTLRPTEHGETWVTYDGGEIDQDIGNYERFLNMKLPKSNSMTTGQIFKSVIERERNGEYGGETVQIIPHVTDEVKNRIVSTSYDVKNGNKPFDFVLVEIGGIVGDIENIPFLVGTQSLEREVGKDNILYTLVTYMPIPSHLGEMKTKPTQTAISALMERGIIPDIILCRGKDVLDDIRKKKIETYVNIKKECIISVPDVDSIYRVPIVLEEQNLGEKILKKFNIAQKQCPNWDQLNGLIETILNSEKVCNVSIVCKYLMLGNYQVTDAYLSVAEALKHAGAHLGVKLNIKWVDSLQLTHENVAQMINTSDGVIVPGGFGSSGVDGKLVAIQYARENNIPFLGLCYGMQLAVIEYARNVHNLTNAHTTEIDPNTKYPVVDMMENKKNIMQIGGTLRLGEYISKLKKDSLVSKLYESEYATEKHRHRYEINPKYTNELEDENLTFSGKYNNGSETLMEYLELQKNNFFVATQAHPELSSSLFKPNPLFTGFLKAIICLPNTI